MGMNEYDLNQVDKRRKELSNKIFTNKQGYQYIVTEYKNHRNVTINFVNTNIYFITNYTTVIAGNVMFPYIDGSLWFESAKMMYDGKIFTSKYGDTFKIINYINTDNIYIQAIDNDYIMKTRLSNILSGTIKSYPFKKNKYNGYIGVNKYSSSDFNWLKNIWGSMLRRVNCEKTYENVSVCEEWLYYGNFADWYMGYLSSLNKSIQYEIDKDILSDYYNVPKVYSPKTCCLVPSEINVAYISNRRIFNSEDSYIEYKDQKKLLLTNLATKYYNIGCITDQIYKILINYNLNIDKDEMKTSERSFGKNNFLFDLR